VAKYRKRKLAVKRSGKKKIFSGSEKRESWRRQRQRQAAKKRQRISAMAFSLAKWRKRKYNGGSGGGGNKGGGMARSAGENMA